MLFNYNSMNTRLTLDTLAHELAQWVRQTQVSAMSVLHTADVNSYPGYGLHFDRANKNQFIFFADLNKDKRYQPLIGVQKCGDVGVECQKLETLSKGNTIVTICGETTSGSAAIDCGPYAYANNVDIVFTRPDPDAIIGGDDSTNVPVIFSRARITVASVNNYQRTVEVWTTGQVSVQ